MEQLRGGGNGNEFTLGDRLVASYTKKLLWPPQELLCPLNYLQREGKLMLAQTHACDSHCSLIYNCQSTAALGCSAWGGWVNSSGATRRWEIIQPWKKMSYQAPKSQGETSEAVTKGKEPIRRGLPPLIQLCDILEKAKWWWLWLPGVEGREEGMGRAQGNSRAMKPLCDTVMVDTCHSTCFTLPHSATSPAGNAVGSCGLCMLMNVSGLWG